MASKSCSKLTEADIPGASLEGRAPEALKIAELKLWLRIRGATGLSKLKTKSDYVQRFVYIVTLAIVAGYLNYTSAGLDRL